MATLNNQNTGGPASPPYGEGGPLRRWLDARHRHAVEDLLKHVHACEQRGQTASAESVSGATGWSSRRAVKVIAEVEASGYIKSTERGIELTGSGRQLAMHVIRAHRLWERYLADEAGMPLSRVHAEANRREHYREVNAVDRLDASLGHPRSDPHGDPIPTADGQLPAYTAMSLNNWPINRPARIRHIEDEPASVFYQIDAMGLLPGQTVQVEASTPEGLRVSFDGRTTMLPPVVAANVFVEASPAGVEMPESIHTLSALDPGRDAVIRGFDPTLRGFHRRRLLDLGFTPGTTIRAERQSMFRDPRAYRVRGSLVALRREQAQKVHIEPMPSTSAVPSGAAS